LEFAGGVEHADFAGVAALGEEVVDDVAFHAGADHGAPGGAECSQRGEGVLGFAGLGEAVWCV
jgi:hypothetical protein